MAIVTTDDKYYKEIANAIRTHNPTEGQLKPEHMYLSIYAACDRQYSVGVQYGFSEGAYGGKESEKQRFWDEFQKNGSRTDYFCGFAGYGWHTGTFFPRYDIKPVNARQMFWYFGQMSSIAEGLVKIDLVERLKECGVVLDFSSCTNFHTTFSYARFTRVGVIDTTKASDVNYIFKNTFVETVDKLILKSDGSQALVDSFYNCTMLKDIAIEGVIGTNVYAQGCTKLSKDSIASFVNALSTTTIGRSVTFSKTAVNNAFSTEEWAALAATRSNWTINLV